MKTQLTVLNETFTISAKLITSGVHFPFDPSDTLFHNQFSISVKTDKGRFTSPFYGSHSDYINGKDELTNDDLQDCFSMLCSDAISGSDSFSDFCSNLGYDEDSRRAEKTYKECKKIADKFSRITSVDLYDLSNSLQEMEEAR